MNELNKRGDIVAGSNNEDDFLNSLLGTNTGNSRDNSVDLNDISGDSSDIESILNSLSKDESSVNDNLTDIDKLIESDVDSAKDKKKKKGLFSKKKDKKEKKEKKSKKKSGKVIESETAKILEETGSTAEDMQDFRLDEADLFRELDSIADIKEKESKAEKKKKKKAEKVKKAKKKSGIGEGRIKLQKPKITEPEEKVYISPIMCVLCVTVIVFVILGVFFGGSTYRYNNNVEKASNYYVEKEYDKAYELLAGMDLKDSDKGFYRQVRNIMYVKKHINDFNTYIELEKYGDALEALLRGIECYDENIGISNELGTVDVLNSLLDDIDTSLKSYYSLSMEEARAIILIENKSEAGKVITEKAQNIKLSSE